MESMKSSRVSEAVINDFEEAIDSVKCSVYNLMTRVGLIGNVSEMLAPSSQKLTGLVKANAFLSAPTIKLRGTEIHCKAKSATHLPIADLKISHMDLTSTYLAELYPWLVDQWKTRSTSKKFSYEDFRSGDKRVRTPTIRKMENMEMVRSTFLLRINLRPACIMGLHNNSLPPDLVLGNFSLVGSVFMQRRRSCRKVGGD